MGTFDYSRVERNTRRFLENLQKNSGPPIFKLSPEQPRPVLSPVQAAPIEKPEADIEARRIPSGPAEEVSVQIVRPTGTPSTSLPVVVYCHGGGWVHGGSDTHDRLARDQGTIHDLVMLNPITMTRAPRAAIEQAYEMLKQVMNS
jgi:acetyl esterase